MDNLTLMLLKPQVFYLGFLVSDHVAIVERTIQILGTSVP